MAHCRLIVACSMAVNRLWYPDAMLSRSRSSPLNVRRIPSAVESCLQWQDGGTAAERSVVRTTLTTTTTKSVEQTRHHGSSPHSQFADSRPAGYDISTQYDGRRTPDNARHNTTRYTSLVFPSDIHCT